LEQYLLPIEANKFGKMIDVKFKQSQKLSIDFNDFERMIDFKFDNHQNI
jgi:hypothetical protein